MKTKLFFALLFLANIAICQAQNGNYASSVGISGGYAEDGFGVMANYNYHLDRNSFLQMSIFAAIAEDKGTFDIPYNIFTFQPGYFRKIWEQRNFKKYALNLGGGGVLGYEVINNGNNTLDNGALIDAKSQFIYGAYLGIELEIILGNAFSIVIKANESYHANSDIGNFYPYAGVGLRYFLF